MRLSRRDPIHFIGIGGVGMSAIASVLLEMGYQISGSDIRPTHRTERLARAGARVAMGHRPENLDTPGLVVYNTAIPDTNVELRLARELNLPVLHRADMLSAITADQHRIAVAGTHGKTTTTSMLSVIFAEAGLDPTMVVGGDVKQFGTNGRLGRGDYAIVEACESDRSFLKLLPCSQVITNVEAEHLDVHKSLSTVVEAFVEFVSGASPDGFVVGCHDCPVVRAIMDRIPRNYLSYGLAPEADFSARDIALNGRGASLDLVKGGRAVGRVRLEVPGRHNVLNALAALAAADACGVPLDAAITALGHFVGAQRRFDVITEADGILIVDDYGHHPTEIRATLEAARAGFPDRRIVAVFQPHLYSRTQLFLDEFGAAFADADVVIINEIYAAREAPRDDISGRHLFEAVRRNEPGKPVEYIPEKDDIAGYLLAHSRPGDLVMTIGAGDIREVAHQLAEAMGE
ncbi:MAG: UDP-N-acetylmuramate--L-alanine ligase [Armatimonadota bacterium]